MTSRSSRYASVVGDPAAAAEQLFERVARRPDYGRLRLVCRYEHSEAIFEFSYWREGATTTYLVSWTHQNNGRLPLRAGLRDGFWHVRDEQWLSYDNEQWQISRPSLLAPPGFVEGRSVSLRVADFAAFSRSWLLFETHFLNLFEGMLPRGRRFGFTGLLVGRQGARRLNSVAFAYLLTYAGAAADDNDDDSLNVAFRPVPITFSLNDMRLFEGIILPQGHSASTGAARTGIAPCWRWAVAASPFTGRWQLSPQAATVASASAAVTSTARRAA